MEGPGAGEAGQEGLCGCRIERRSGEHGEAGEMSRAQSTQDLQVTRRSLVPSQEQWGAIVGV